MFLTLLAAGTMAMPAVDLLPDIIIWDRYLASAYVGTTSSSELPSGRRCLRFATTTANIGSGTLELSGGSPTGGLQPVNQRIFRSDNTFYDRLAGNFTYHSGHGHMHFDDWTNFTLRQVTANNGVGNIVAVGEKQSFCIIETTVYDSTMPGFNNANWGPYSCAATKQGTRPGRADTYGATLTGQYIDLTGVPDGLYWLEGVVDPLIAILESDKTNNLTRVLVNVGSVPPAVEDAYEDNDSKAIVDARPQGGPNSPNLGLVNAPRFIDNLSANDAEDWYKFRLNKAGSSGDYIRIETPYHQGQNLFLYLMSESGTVLASLTDTYGVKQLSLNNRPAGTYYARIVRNTGNNPRYMLTIDPAGQLPPNVTLTSPSGQTWVEKAYDTIPVRWLCNDPEGDPKTITLLADRNPVVGSSNIQLSGFENLNGSDLQANIITVDFAIGRWYIIARAFDGGAQNHAISPGVAVIYVKGDVDWNGVCNEDDWAIYFKHERNGKFDPEWIYILDMDRDGDFDAVDRQEFYDHAHGG